MNKTHYFAFVAGIIAAVLWIGAPYDSGTELVYLVVGFFIFGWVFDQLFETQWNWLSRGLHKVLCIVGLHDYKNYLDGLFCVWCHKQRHLTEAEIAEIDEAATRINEEKARLYAKELEQLKCKLQEVMKIKESEEHTHK